MQWWLEKAGISHKGTYEFDRGENPVDRAFISGFERDIFSISSFYGSRPL